MGSVVGLDRAGSIASEWRGFMRPTAVFVRPDCTALIVDAGSHQVIESAADGAGLQRFGGRGIGRRRTGVVDHANRRGQIFGDQGAWEEAFGAFLYCMPRAVRIRVDPMRRAMLLCLLLPGCERSNPAAPAPAPAPLPAPTAQDSAAAERPAPPDGFVVESADRTYVVHFSPAPYELPLNDMFALEVMVFAASDRGKPLRGLDLRVDAAMPEHRHGMNTIPEVTEGAGGLFTADGMLLHMPGYWELYFDVTRDGMTERAMVPVDLE